MINFIKRLFSPKLKTVRFVFLHEGNLIDGKFHYTGTPEDKKQLRREICDMLAKRDIFVHPHQISLINL